MSSQQVTPQLAHDYIEQLNPSQGLWINGQGRPGTGGNQFDVENPATNTVITSIASANSDDAIAAVDAAAAAFPSWRHVAPRERGEILRRAYELMHTHKSELAAVMSLENGKGLADSLGEVDYAAEFFRWFSEEAVRSEGDYYEAPAGGTRTIVTHHPVGVAALITPWNFPAAMATRKIAPALAAGCTVVLKPAGDTPLTALAVCHILAQAGVPDGVVNMVPSASSSEISQAWLDDPRVKMVSFTGSTRVGSLLMEQSAKRIVNQSMELGGNASFIVGKTADIDAAVDGAMYAKYRNGGQACTAANRLFIHKDIIDEFTDAFVTRFNQLKVGNAFDGADIGPVIHQRAYDNIRSMLDGAVQRGATIVSQITDYPDTGYFVPPTVLRVDDYRDDIMTHEIFGPLTPITTFSDTQQVIDMANATQFGLASYVYDRDLKWALTVAESLETGMIGVNRGAVSDPAAPFGGFKQSGIGREGAREGIREFQETQYFSVDWS